VDRLPKTRSGKILRGTMVSIADSKQFWAPATIDDPAVLDEVRTALQAMGYAKKPDFGASFCKKIALLCYKLSILSGDWHSAHNQK